MSDPAMVSWVPSGSCSCSCGGGCCGPWEMRHRCWPSSSHACITSGKVRLAGWAWSRNDVKVQLSVCITQLRNSTFCTTNCYATFDLSSIRLSQTESRMAILTTFFSAQVGHRRIHQSQGLVVVVFGWNKPTIRSDTYKCSVPRS
jgi:hypothetical protein